MINHQVSLIERIPDRNSLLVSPKYDWWTVGAGVRVGWRCATMTHGAQCVTTTGTWWMPTWCVSSWVAEWLWRWAAALTSDKAQGSSCWIMWTAEEVKQTWASAVVWAGVSTTATTTRMWVLPAEVKPLFNFKLGGVLNNLFTHNPGKHRGHHN